MNPRIQVATFKEVVCKALHLADDQFEKHVLMNCAYPVAKPHFWLAQILNNDFLNPERVLISDLEWKLSTEEVTKTVNGPIFLDYLGHIPRYHRKCKIRLSGTLLMRLAEKCFNDSTEEENMSLISN